jgi:hypothetical protein
VVREAGADPPSPPCPRLETYSDLRACRGIVRHSDGEKGFDERPADIIDTTEGDAVAE